MTSWRRPVSLLWVSMVLSKGARAMSVNQPSGRKTCAIIGGGVAGLSCANQLASKFDVTVFDTGRLRPGGRASSRLPGDPSKEDDDKKYFHLSKQIVDHAAQVLYLPTTDRFKEFKTQIQAWEKAGVVTRFEKDSLYQIESSKDGRIRLKASSDIAYYGSPEMGMAAIPDALLDTSKFDLRQDVWVSPSSGVKYMPKSGQWKVSASGKVLGYFDQLIIAHNGKCADRLMSKSPAKDVHSLLRVNFAPSVPAHGGKRMTLSSIYSYTFVLPKDSALAAALPNTFLGGFVKNEKLLRFLSCQSHKYKSGDDDVEVWTVLSSSTFAKKHKAPQEFLPDETVEEVTNLLLRAIERSLGLDTEILRPIEQRLQLWGAALPLNIWETQQGYIYDAEWGVGVCGDWLTESSLAGGWSSGYWLGEALTHESNAESVGLDGSFVRSESAARNGLVGTERAPKKQKESVAAASS